MKRLLFITSFLLLSFLSHSQAPKSANLIIVKTSDSTEMETYKRVARVLSDEGYAIKNADKELMIINTEYKNLNTVNGSVKIIVSIQGNEIKIRGKWLFSVNHINGDDSEIEEEVRNEGSKISIKKNSWNELERLANLLGSQITYLIK